MFKRIWQSLVTRMMLYFFLMGFLLVVMFGINIANGIKVHFKQEVLPNISQYLVYIANDIGSPPDFDKAQQLTNKLSFELVIRGPGINWQSQAEIPSLDNLSFEQAPAPYQAFKIARHKNKRTNFVALSIGPYEYTFMIGKLFKGPQADKNYTVFMTVIILLIILFILIWTSLKPLKVIESGIKKIADGDLENTIVVKQSTEFKSLASGINEMVEQIKAMLEGKEQLLLAISHELRSPLTRAKVNLALMSESASKDALTDDVNEMESLISQILESQRLNQHHNAIQKTELKLDCLIEKVISDFFQDAGITVNLTSLTILADKTRLILLIKNLLDNALKYTDVGQPEPVISLFEKGEFVVIEIEDFGCGMDHQELSKITEAFYRIDKSRHRHTGGFGLGLYLCHLIVKAHQGEMVFKSQLEIGSLVTIKLPKK